MSSIRNKIFRSPSLQSSGKFLLSWKTLNVLLVVVAAISLSAVGGAQAQDADKLGNHVEPLALVSNQKTLTEMATGSIDYADVCDLNQSTVSGISSTNVILFVGTVSSLVFSFIGIFPAFFIHTDAQEKVFRNSMLFKLLLSFAAGSLISQVFLHIIPENSSVDKSVQTSNGLYSIGFLFLYLVIDKMTGMIPNAHALGTLNLVANFFENSAHGTTVVGAFRTSFWFGFVASICTLIHIIPHEFADFALLLRDGYSRNAAIFAQLITAFAGSIGATVVHTMSTNFDQVKTCALSAASQHAQDDQSGSLLLCFTTGGFLYIALVGIIPEIIEETDRKTSIYQLVSFAAGVILIYTLISVESILPTLF